MEISIRYDGEVDCKSLMVFSSNSTETLSVYTCINAEPVMAGIVL